MARMQEGEPLFYFAAMSPYSWLAAERIGRLLPDALWRPVTAAFVFKAAGRTSWGLQASASAGSPTASARADSHGLGPITWPEPWPTNDLPVARAMAYADGLGLLKPYALSAMRLAFQEGADLAELETLLEAGTAVLDPRGGHRRGRRGRRRQAATARADRRGDRARCVRDSDGDRRRGAVLGR